MLSSDQTYFWRGYVAVQTDLGLDDAAKGISSVLLGGVPFEGRDSRIRDELDAVYAETFGIRFILTEQPEGELILEFHSTRKLAGAVDLDLSSHVAAMLGEWSDGTVSLLE
jgi:hypothetical protein